MKFKFFASAIAALALAGCSNNDEVLVDNNEVAGSESELSYLSISLVTDASAISRGTSDGYQEGADNDENEVKTVGFIFFNGDGSQHSHVLYTINNNTTTVSDKSDVIADPSELDGNNNFNFTDDDQDTNGAGTDNIEKVSDAVIVFKNLTNNSTPRNVLAVLNVTADEFSGIYGTEENKNLTAVLGLANGDKEGDAFKGDNGFVMSNSICIEEKATPISASDFKTSQADAAAAPVEIYMERMAAKVELTRRSGNVTTGTSWPVQTGTEKMADTELSIEVVAWGLSGMNKDSYWFKNINDEWNLGWNWDKSDDHRSYWAQDNDYTSEEGTYVKFWGWSDTEGDNLVVNGTVNKDASLIYKSWNDYTPNNGALGFGNATYCYENTFDGALDVSKSTNVLVLAKFKQGENEIGEDVVWYNYNGVLYDETNYEKAALQYFADNTDIRVKTTTGESTQYSTLTTNDVTPAAEYQSDGYSVLTATIAEGKSLVIRGAGDNGADKEVTVDELNAELKKGTRAISYKNGMMYYCIPIQHLNNHSTETTHTNCTGEYGVVRNHWYQVEVGNITSLGKGVYDPAELIVPNDDEKEFFLAAKLYILSWHKVKQSVDLDEAIKK